MPKILLSICLAAVAAAVATADSHDDRYLRVNGRSFAYSVNNPVTNDIKQQWERRLGDKVEGSYRISQADGKVRIVDYTADGSTGFQAKVRYEGGMESLQQGPSSRHRNYLGGIFVRERNYGRGLGHL